MQAGNQQIVGDQTAGEIHREDNQLHDEFLSAQKRFGQGIGEQDGHDQRNGSTENGVKEGIAVSHEEVGIRKDLLVGFQIKANGPQRNLIVHNGMSIGERKRQHVKERDQADEQHQDHDEVDKTIKQEVLPSFITFIHNERASFLIDAFAGGFAADGVGTGDQDHADDAAEQANGSGVGVVLVGKADTVDQSVQNIADGGIVGSVHQQDFFKAQSQHTANVQNQHNHDGGHDGRNGHIPDLLQTACAVHFGGLEQIVADAGNGGQIDDGRPAHELPAVGQDIDDAEPAGFVHEVDGVNVEHVFQQHVQQAAAGREQLAQNGDDHNGGDKAGHIGNGLDDFLELFAADLVDQNSKEDGQREVDRKVQKRKDQSVFKSAPECRVFEKQFEITQSDPLGSPGAHAGPITAERKDVAEHRHILKYDEVDNGQKHH